MFRTIRIAVLLYILLIVAITTYSTRARNTDWDSPLWVSVYPINGDGSIVVRDYIGALSEERFRPLETMMRQQAKRWGVALKRPIDIKFAPEVKSIPPAPPTSSNPIAIVYWSLRLRFWAWRNDTFDGPADIRLFVVYYDPAKYTTLAHSLGLQKGFLGVVNGFGESHYDGRNNVVLAHEMLHTLGASDKYDRRTNYPSFPDGFADPDRSPRYPQIRAELMAGRIPLSEHESKMPVNLSKTVIGRSTALEIGWLRLN